MLSGMRKTATGPDRVISTLLLRQGNLITRSQALEAGLTESALRYRTRVGGSWRSVLPGIYVNSNGPLAKGQQEIAAVLYAGGQCVITGSSALEHQGVRVPAVEFIDVLVPSGTKRRDAAFVRVHRTEKMPDRPLVHGGIRLAPAARAVADAARSNTEFREVRALVADAVQRKACTIGQLADELRNGPKQGSGLLRAVLEEVADGVASGAEGDLRKLIISGRLPQPMFNARLYVGSEFLAQPDVWWKDAGVAGEVDSREWHLSPDAWARTMARHDKMSAQGILVLHFTPAHIKTQGAQVLAQLRSAIASGSRRPALDIRTVQGR
jgi:hypothetical protein